MPLTAFGINCTLSAPDEDSSTEVLLSQLLDELAAHDVDCEAVRSRAFAIHPGTETDMGDGDEWPELHDRILAADILVLATPIWVGNPSSECRRVLERIDAMISEEDEDGRPVAADKVAVVAVVGNEDGAHAVAAQLFQGLNDAGFTVPAMGATYWVGEAMGDTDYRDLDETPDAVATTTASVARHAAHLARLLADDGYPAG